MTVFGNPRQAGLAALAAMAAVALAACSSPAPSAAPESTTAAPATASPTPAGPSPSASPGTTATVGGLVPGFPQQLLPVMPGATVVSSSFDKTTSPATAALVATTKATPAAILAFYTKSLAGQGFKAVPGDAVGSVASKDFVRGDSETVNVSIIKAGGVATFTIGANVAAKSAK